MNELCRLKHDGNNLLEAAFSGLITGCLLLLGCTSEGGTEPRAEPAGPTPPSLAAAPETGPPSPDRASKEHSDEPIDTETPTSSSSSPPYDKQLPLEGTVRFGLSSGCSGCSGGKLSAKAKVRGNTITIDGEVLGCEGPCEAYWPASGSVTLRGLHRKTYRVQSSLKLTSVKAMTASSAQRAKLALDILQHDCDIGVQSLSGEEQPKRQLIDEVGACLAKVPGETRFEVISSMLTWENKGAYVPVLVENLDDTKVAYLAARVLGLTEDDAAVGPLIEALKTDDESLRWDAARSLKIITGEDFGEDHERWQRWFASR